MDSALDKEDSSAEYLVALVAAVLGGGAFIVAVLQALLQYLTSNNAREKCTRAAIGYANAHVSTSWSLASWKMRVHYPLLDLSANKVTDSMVDEQNRGIRAHSGVQEIYFAKQGAYWNDVGSDYQKLTNWHIADAYHVLSNSDRPLTIWDLTWKQSGTFLTYRLRNWLHPLQRPRASWAQLLLSLRVSSVESLIVTKVDAETVYSNLDTPVQRIKLSDLGKFAFLLGFRSVEIDVPNRTFSAWSPVASITTEEVPVVGKVLRFEGDIVALRDVIAPCRAHWVGDARWWVAGRAHFGDYMADNHYWPLQVVGRAVGDNISMDDYFEWQREARKATRKGFQSGPILRESYTLRNICIELIVSKDPERFSSDPLVTQAVGGNDPTHKNQNSAVGARLRDIYLYDEPRRSDVTHDELRDCFARWQHTTESRVPTLMAAATFMSVHTIAAGFPSRALLHVLLPWVRLRARRFHGMPEGLHFVSTALDEEIADGSLAFASIWSSYYMGAPALDDLLSWNGTLCWGTTSMRPFFRLLPAHLQGEVVTTAADGTQVLRAVVIQETWDLLRRFEVQKWSRTTAEMGKAIERDVTIVNLLWIQVILIDIAIQFHIRGGWAAPPSTNTPRESQDGEEEAAEKYKTAAANADDAVLVDDTRSGDGGGRRDSSSDVVVIRERSGSDHVAAVDGGDENDGESGASIRSGNVQPSPGDDVITRDPEYQSDDDDADADDEDNEDEDDDDDEDDSPSHVWKAAEAAVVRSIVKSWRPDEPTTEGSEASSARSWVTSAASENSGQPEAVEPGGGSGGGGASLPSDATLAEWEIAAHLEENLEVFPGVAGQERVERCRKLADLLELRSIFLIAFLVVQPDSSDIYLMADGDIEMPMA